METRFHKAFVTGIGIVSPLGNDSKQNLQALLENRHGVGKVTLFDTSSNRCQIAAEIRNLPSGSDLTASRTQARRMDRAGRMLLAASIEAFEQADVTSKMRQSPSSIVMGATGGGMQSGEKFYRGTIQQGRKSPRPSPLMQYVCLQQLLDVQSMLELSNTSGMVIANACASGANAIGYAFQLIRSGTYDWIVAGGYDALCEFTFTGFDSLQASTTHACRPFDRQRNGLVLGEGAAVLVIESEDHMQKRGATPLCEILGYGQSTDIHHMTQPHPDGDGAMRAMQASLNDAGVKPDELDYINAHGTATPLNDLMEAKAIRQLLGSHWPKVHVSSTKAATGHTLGAAGALEAAFSIMAIHEKFVPPNLNFQEPDPGLDLNICRTAQRADIHLTLSNSFGFGGANASLVFGAVNR